MIRTLLYDGSFTGCLTALFEVYEYKIADPDIQPESRSQSSLFGDVHLVHTDEAKAARVWKGLKQKISPQSVPAFYRAFLSEEKGVENQLLAYLRHIFGSRPGAEHDYSHPAVNYLVSTAKKVYREKHRMEAFVRFQEQSDGLFIATIDPDFQVLPLIQSHFERRYADQRWLIYDTRRRQGLYYDLHQSHPVTLDAAERATAGSDTATGSNTAGSGTAGSNTTANPDANAPLITLDEKEEAYQNLWQQYFSSVNIAARKNMRLHIRHMPTRYWKYLPEKQPFIPRS